MATSENGSGPELLTATDRDDPTDPDVFGGRSENDVPTVPRCVTCGRPVDGTDSVAFERGAYYAINALYYWLAKRIGKECATAIAIKIRDQLGF